MKLMKCIAYAVNLVPNKIKVGNQYYLDEKSIISTNSGKQVGLFYFDSLKSDYAGIADMDRMEEITVNGTSK